MFSVLKKISDFAGTRRGLLKKSMAVAFLGAAFAALQFAALMLTLDILVGGADLRIWPVIGVMVVSVVGRAACSYWSTNAETETGYFMVAEKRIHIGDRLRYIPMGYFNDNSLGNITPLDDGFYRPVARLLNDGDAIARLVHAQTYDQLMTELSA